MSQQLSDYPKRIMIVPSNLQSQMGIKSRFNCEIISSRTIKHKMMEITPDYENWLCAPTGYRLYRVWNMRTNEELDIFN